ncbi:MAG: hypothetical protein JW788_02475 [Candidatus Omnitrophica bacterium]|nr:hypothetical protein [Candidatus Omnitrophota bacterium]
MARLFAAKKGFALILVYIATAFFTILSLPLLDKIINETWGLKRQRMEKEVFYLAEGAIEDAISQFTYAIANFQADPDVERYPDTGVITTLYAASSAFPSGAEADSVINEAEEETRLITDSDGTVVEVKAYVVTSTCEHPANSNIKATLNQAVILRLVYTFQHTVFYSQDLEILPAPSMTLAGRIHSNSDIFLDCYDSGATLTVNSEYLRSAGHIYHGRKIDRRHSPGRVRIKKAGTGSYNYMNPSGFLNVPPYYDSESWPSADGTWIADATTRWGGTVQDSSHGVSELVVPSVGSIATDGYYSQIANIYIYNDTVYTGLPAALGGSGVPISEGSGADDLPPGTITTTDQFKNNREGKFVSMTNIDMQKLAGYVDDADKADGVPSRTSRIPSNGLMYVTRDQAVGAGEQPGIRLVKGDEIERSNGLTVVSNDPVYVQGDYNTVSKKAAAIICDSLNILSNSWDDDADSTQTTEPNFSTYRTASTTTVNAAFIAGTETTMPWTSDGGGLQNYPRFHEKWTGITLNITGSFVSLGESQIATGHYAWGPPQYYPPNRNWQWDTDFSNHSNLPPFTPWAVEARRGAWWKD